MGVGASKLDKDDGGTKNNSSSDDAGAKNNSSSDDGGG